MEVYTDSLLVKSIKDSDDPSDLWAALSILRCYNMKLNPDKCTFEVASGKFLGYLITQKGIEANPSKIRGVRDLK